MLRLGLVVALIGIWAPTAHGFDRARPMGLYAVGAGAPLAMVDSRIDIVVRGPIVETVVVQRFRNPADRATEATYTFPLPADAAVSAMAIRIGVRTIHAAIERRDAAQRRYEAAVAAGVAAAVLDQERPDIFTQTVSAIPAYGVVEIALRYDTLARYQAGTWELVVPMVVAPRYVPGAASGQATTGSGRAPDTDRAPDASRVTPAASPGAGGSTAVAIHFTDEPSEVTSATHELGGTRRDATLSDPHSDHDAIVRWRSSAASAGWVERDGDAGFAAVVVEAPPPGPRKAAVRLIVALDRAATTRGDGDAVAHPLIRALLGSLTGADRVRVIGSVTVGWSAPADALRAIERTWATPGTVVDLTRVLETASPDGAAIVLVSDGLVADDPAAIAAARRLGVPVHVIGIGPAPARAALSQIAAATGGTVRFAVASDDVTALAHGAIADVSSLPSRLTVNWGTLAASDVEPAVLPRLGAGQAMLVLARIKRVQSANARSRGEVFAFEALGASRAIDGATTSHGALARRWARERLGDLVAGAAGAGAVTDHALGYGLVSPYTSLVAIGSEVVISGGVKRSVAVPVSLPAGMQWRAVKQAMDVEVGAVAHGEPPPPRVAAAPKAPPAPPSPAPTAPRPAQPPGPGASAEESARVDEAAAEPPASGGETIVIEGRAPFIVGQNLSDSTRNIEPETIAYAARRRWSLIAALGGGLAFDHGAHGLAAFQVRLETNRRTRLGVEAGLWLVGRVDPEGRALLSIARSGLARWLELGFGAGVQLGNGAGVASSLRLRINTSIPVFGGFLRYDAGVRLTRPNLEAEQAITLGVELSY